MNVAKLALTVLVAAALAACGKKPAEPAQAKPATAAAPARWRPGERPQPEWRMLRMSPSWTTYSFPSRRSFPSCRARDSLPRATKSS